LRKPKETLTKSRNLVKGRDSSGGVISHNQSKTEFKSDHSKSVSSTSVGSTKLSSADQDVSQYELGSISQVIPAPSAGIKD
jgi:hypothetical protein